MDRAAVGSQCSEAVTVVVRDRVALRERRAVVDVDTVAADRAVGIDKGARSVGLQTDAVAAAVGDLIALDCDAFCRGSSTCPPCR